MSESQPQDHRAGYATILGWTNVGKSSLLNRLLGSPRDDALHGGTGVDFMHGNGGRDTLYRADGTTFESLDGGLAGLTLDFDGSGIRPETANVRLITTNSIIHGDPDAPHGTAVRLLGEQINEGPHQANLRNTIVREGA